jgi:DNA-binding transcriptional ArsR family regulator
VKISQDGLAAEVFKALGDPVRWSIVTQIAAAAELPCAELEQTLPVSKPTISYHTKILQQAGLLSVRKEGRNYFYALRCDVLVAVQRELSLLAPPQPAGHAAPGQPAQPVSAQPAVSPRERSASRAAGDDEVVLLTW